MTVKAIIPIGYTATQADIDAGLTNNLPKGTSVIVVNSSNQPVDVKTAQGGGVPPVDSAGLKNNFAATLAPTATNDSSQGYAIGSRWIDTTNDESYICLDATVSSAVWSRTTVGTIGEVANLQTTLDGKSATSHNHDTAYTVIAHGTNISNPHSVTASQVGLGSVNNTADTAKPVSTATQTALDLKAPLASPAFTGTPTGITKAHVGLGSVDNVADTDKPISTATQTALNAKQATLVSGTGIKTVNGTTLLGSGNITTSADLDGGVNTTITNEGLATTGAPAIDTITAPGETIIRWTGTGSFTVPIGVTNVRAFLVGGGGGGGGGEGVAAGDGGGGGGAGELLDQSSFVVIPGATLALSVGGGGAGANSLGGQTGTNGTNGTNSMFGTLVARGGGGGGGNDLAANAGGSGGGGGGRCSSGIDLTGGASTAVSPGVGFAGGAGTGICTNRDGAGGGGAGGVGGSSSGTGSAGIAGTGGAAVTNNITGALVTYAGGGGGGIGGGQGTVGAGGNANAVTVGGVGGAADGAGTVGVANTGSGGGGGGARNGEGQPSGAAGGSGVVIIRFATQTRVYKALASYADNAAAIAGLLRVGQFYKNSTTGAVQQVVA